MEVFTGWPNPINNTEILSLGLWFIFAVSHWVALLKEQQDFLFNIYMWINLLLLFILYQVWCQDLHNTANKHKEWYCQGSRCFRHLSEKQTNKALFSKGGQTLACVAHRSCKDHLWRYSKAHGLGQQSLMVLLEEICWTRQPPEALSSLKYFLIYSLPSPLYSL